jgi:iron complex transport system substrate-binding protein
LLSARTRLLALFAFTSLACRRHEALPHLSNATIHLTQPPSTNLRNSCPDEFQPEYDYFPEKVSFRFANQLRVEYHRSYKVVSFTPTVKTGETFRFVLYQCGTPPPLVEQGTRLVSIPSGNFVLNDSGYGSTVVRLGLLDRMKGVSSLRSFSQPDIIAAAKTISEVGSQSHSSLENTVAVDPALVFLFYSAYPNFNMHPRLWEMGVQAIPLADHFEPTPLGRAEWVKFFGMIYNREREAEAIFEPLAERYRKLSSRAAAVGERPGVLLGSASGRDIWALNGGRNFMAQLVSDAGGRYFWNDLQSGSLIQADYEKVLDLSSVTSTWFGSGGVIRARSIASLTKHDPKLAYFAPVARRSIYAPDQGLDKRGAYPLADQSLDNPDLMLGDLIHALHPALLPDWKPRFYRSLK